MSDSAAPVLHSSMYGDYLPNQEYMLIDFAAASLIPPDDLYIDEWVDQDTLYLSARVTRSPGFVKLRMYQRRPLRALRKYKRVVLVWGAQTGKTIVLQSFIGYCIDQEPGPMMVVYPSQDICNRRSRKHLRTLIEDSPVLRSHTIDDRHALQRYSYTLDRMDVVVAWAGSPAQMASEPIQNLIRDEIAKGPPATITEADWLNLSLRRTISYSFMARILDATTPTLPDAPGWRDLLEGTYEELYFPCPECGYRYVLRFKDFDYPARELDEPESAYYKRVLETTTCRCPECKHGMTQIEKLNILNSEKEGDWRPNNPDAEICSLHLPSWYAPYVTFGEVAVRYLKSADDPEARRDVINSDFAEPWHETAGATTVERILAYRSDYEESSLPHADPVFTFMTVDVQKDYMWYNIWSHRPHFMHLVEQGTVSDFGQLELLQDRLITRPEGEDIFIHHAFIDSRYRTQEVYEYCATRQYTTPVMGMNEIRESTKMITWDKVETVPGTNIKLPSSVLLMKINSREFSEETIRCLHSGYANESDEPEDFDSTTARFALPRTTPTEYCKHLTRRFPVEEVDSRGRYKRVWKEVHKRHDHFDLFAYNLAARYLYREDIKALDDPPPEEEDSGNGVVAEIV